MNAERALASLGAAARGARVESLLHATAAKRVYLVRRRAARLVLRVDEPAARDWPVDRRAELRALRAAAAAGVAPEPIAWKLAPPARLLTACAPGRAWTVADLADRRRLAQIAALLRRVHAVRVPGPPLDLEATARDYARRAGRVSVGAASAATIPAGATSVATGNESRLTPLLQRRSCTPLLHRGGVPLCHHDPLAQNIVGFRHPVLVDWEYAGPGDPLFDLAAVWRHHRLPQRLKSYFLAAYFGSSAEVPAEAVAAMGEVYARIVELWEAATAVESRLTPLLQRRMVGAA